MSLCEDKVTSVMKTTTQLQVHKSKAAQTSVREAYDLLVLGSGEGGKFLAWTLAAQGLKTAVIERKYIGGSCPNIACLPSKNVIHSAKVASYFFRSHEFGISKDNCRISMAADIFALDDCGLKPLRSQC